MSDLALAGIAAATETALSAPYGLTVAPGLTRVLKARLRAILDTMKGAWSL